MENVGLLKITSNCLEYYRKNVKHDNMRIGMDIARKKLTRNMSCGLIYKISKGKTWYAYGNLRFAVKDDTVVWMENSNSAHPKWKMDKKKHVELSEQLGIRVS